jgi:hypothetical protein
MEHTLVPDDLFDRQVAAVRTGVDGLVTMIDGQRSVFAAAVQLPLLSFEALAHLTRSMIAAALEVSDRAATTSTESIDRLRDSLTPVGGAATNGSTPGRKATAAAAS